MWLDPRLWLALVAVLGLSYCAGDYRGEDRGKREVQAEWNKAALAATQENQRLSNRWNSKLVEAVNNAKSREQKNAVAADGAVRERDQLRDELAASRRQLGTATCASVREHAAALTDVFESCVREYQGVAREADGHASDSLMYQEAWPGP